MQPSQSSDSPSVFRSAAWVQAWIDTWGNHPAIQLIDLGGRSNSLETVYITRQRLKKIIPVNTLSLAGVGCGPISTPRAEYNNINDLVRLAGSVEALFLSIKSLAWQQFVLPDILQGSYIEQQIERLSQQSHLTLQVEKKEPAYAVQIESFDDYLQHLGPNTRLTYFNRRKNLASYGAIEFVDYDYPNMEKAFTLLNKFHMQRWGSPCYSVESQKFMKNFAERLSAQEGRCILQAMAIDGEVVSILFDVQWKNTRYNFQSGYAENKYPKIALGAIHMGYGIQQAIENHQVYDFMAGTGKHTNYKERIATRIQTLSSYSLERSYIKSLRRLQHLFTKKGV